jgi:type I restriction enzyme S subunit
MIQPIDMVDHTVLHYSIPAVQSTGGAVVERGDTIDSAKVLLRNDALLVSRLNPRKGTIVLAQASDKYITVCSTEFVSMTPKSCLGRFLKYAFDSEHVRIELSSRVESATKSHQRVSPADIYKLELAFPPRCEQDAIVRFLAYAENQIFRYIHVKQKLIKLLEEQKQAIIHQAVTRGLNADVQLKRSGVEWLGDVPEHWELRRNGRLFALRVETGSADLPVLEVSLRTGVRVRNLATSINKQTMSDVDKYQCAYPGDIVYNTKRMWQGAVGVAPSRGLVSPAYVVARPLPTVHPVFYEYVFRTTAYMSEVNQHSRGIVSDRNRLYWDQFKQIVSPYPPFDEQAKIVSHLNDTAANINQAIDRSRREITLLHEYRTRLIADVVTGKLDVREAAASLPDTLPEEPYTDYADEETLDPEELMTAT